MDDYLPPTSQSLPYITNSVSYIDQKINKRSRTEQVAAVKQAMMDHGALTTYMYAGGGSVFKKRRSRKHGDALHRRKGLQPCGDDHWLG